MEARLATASVPERIRIRDMLRSQEEQWFPSETGKEKVESGVEMDEEDWREKRRREKGKEKEKPEGDEAKDGSSSSSSSSSTTDAATGPLQFRVLSPMPMGFMPSPPMTAVLQPVLTDLPDETKFSSLSSHQDDDDSDEGSDYCGSDRATEAGDVPDNVSALGATEGAGNRPSLFAIGPDDEDDE
ncbi:hypothetical protein PG993_002091 [Apiospora rasikravindrae]|uniref:Uncharacterized protein n=1 Tax=Apiospora rasikravindrae TaxID=990691 RepID=A0ABR1UD97_9PEZI